MTFYAASDATRNIAVEFVQFFGTGGVPSADVTTIGVTTCVLTSTFQKFSVTVVIPSITGKAIGTSINTSTLAINFWFDAGANFNARTNSLGQQSGTFQMAKVKLHEGPSEIAVVERSFGEELSLCQRYYEKSFPYATVPAQNAGTSAGATGAAATVAGTATNYYGVVKYSMQKRIAPTVTFYNPFAANAFARNLITGANATVTNTYDASESSFGMAANGITGLLVGELVGVHWVADSRF